MYFRGARSDQLCAEGSTGYTKLPWTPGVPDRAWKLMGPELKLVYIVRDPVARIESHYRHRLRAGRIGWDINEVVLERSEFVDVSRYAMQLGPWLERFGPDRVEVVFFEEYVRDRRAGVERVCRFLDAEPPAAEADLEQVHNTRKRARVLPGSIRPLLRPLKRSRFYRQVVRPRMPEALHRALKRIATHPGHVSHPSRLAAATVDELLDRLSDDQRELAALLGRSLPWSVSAIRSRYAPDGS